MYLFMFSYQRKLGMNIRRFLTSSLGQDLLKWEYSTRTPGSMQWVPVTCPQHNTIEFEVQQIPSSEIGPLSSQQQQQHSRKIVFLYGSVS